MNTINLKERMNEMNKKMISGSPLTHTLSLKGRGLRRGWKVGNGGFVIALMAFGVILNLFQDLAFAGAGTQGAQFLKLPVGAKYIAMGEAGTAIADDANAIYYNVAGLVRLEKKSAEYMYGGFMLKDKISGDKDPGQHWIAYAMPISETIGSAGIGIQLFSAGEFTKTDAAATSKGTVNPSDLAVNLSYARMLSEIPVGMTLKIVNSKIENSATAVALDFGAQYTKLMEGKLYLGAALQNLGSGLKYEAGTAPLPVLFKLGSGYKVWENWVASLDIVVPNEGTIAAAFGTDYLHKINEEMNVSGRLGFNTRTIKVDGFSGLSLGFGVGFKIATLDLAWMPMGDLGQTIRFSLGVKF